jgi:multidrug efflux system membrane fusion protein
MLVTLDLQKMLRLGLRLLPKATRAFLLSGLILLSSCSGDKKPPPPQPVPVTVAPVVQRDVPVQLKTIGNVEAYATVSIKARVGGELKQVNFKEGQDVKKGDLLFVIDPRPLEAALKEAQARLARDKALAKKAETDARRYTDLVKRDFVSREQYEQAQATSESLHAVVQADEVAVETARLQLSYCFIPAPLSGRTGNLLADQGNLIKADADKAMVVINQIQPIYVSFAVPELHLQEIKKYMALGQVKVEAVLAREEKQPEEGLLTFVNNTVDIATGTILLKATFANQEKRLWPGLFVNVVVNLTTEPKAVLVPAQAIQTGQGGQFVFVIKPDLTAETRPVVVGRNLDGEVVVQQGLQPGEQVVTDGQLRLVPGAKVEVKGQRGPEKAS